MTINSTTRKTNPFVGNGSAHTFPFTFKVFTDADIVVKKLEASTSIETTLTLGLNNDYIVTLNADQNSNPGGSITLKSGGNNQNLASGFSLVITSDVDALQGVDLTNQGGFFPEVINDALDKAIIIHQQQQTELDRSIRFSLTNTIGSLEITENAAARANKVLGFDNLGEFNVVQELGTYKGNWTAGRAYVVRDLVKDTSTNNIFFCNTAHTSSGSQPLTTNTNSANWDLIVDAATATSAQTSATSSATAAANSATAAANSATAAASSQSAAASSATTASTKATQADTAKTAAQTAQTAAETAKTAAETALDSFDDRYLGAKSSNPTLDNDGNALIDGALYFNTTVNRMRVYDLGNTTWLEVTISGSDLTNTNTVAGAISNVNAVGGNISNVNAVASNATNINAVNSNSSNINTVAGAASNINTVSGSIGNVNTVGGGIANVNTVAAEINNNKLQTVANNINAVVTAANDLNEATSEIDTVANNIANVNNVGNNISNVNSVAGIASNVTAVAGNASNVNTVAGAITNVNNVGGSIANVNTVASNLSGVNSFAERYRTDNSGNNPSTSLNAGDLFYNQASGKLLVYNGQTNAWEETQSVGNFFINTISSFSGTGGNSATFNGSAYKFTLSNAGQFAQQMLVSINGVVQKPNTGTGQPSEGFALDGANIVFSSPPPSGADFFIVTIGASVSIGTPSDNTVTSAKIVDGTIVNADINASAAIAGTKISPDFGSQDIATTGQISGKDLILSDTTPVINLVDSTANPDYQINNTNGVFNIRDTTNNVDRLVVNTDGHVDVVGNLDVGAGLDVTGRIVADSITLEDDGSSEPLLHLRADDGSPWAFLISNDNYHSGTTTGLKWYVANNGNAYQHLQGNGTFEEFHLQQSNGAGVTNTAIKLNTSRGVELNYQGSQKFETLSSGVKITGALNLDTTATSFITIPHDDNCIVFDEGQKCITSNDNTGNFAFKTGSDEGNTHISVGGAESGLAQLTLDSDGTDGMAGLGVGPRRANGSTANFTHAVTLEYSASGFNQFVLRKGSGIGPNTLSTNTYKFINQGNARDGSWTDSANDQVFKVLGDGGSVAITTNDGGGNANVTFNCASQLADTSGSSWRIACGVDSADGHMVFGNNRSVSDGGAAATTARLEITEVGTFIGSSSNNISDERLKKNIATISDATTKIKGLKGRTFEWKEEADLETGTQYGFVAQEMESVVSDLVSDGKKWGLRAFDSNGEVILDAGSDTGKAKIVEYSKGVNVNGVIPILVEAFKEAIAKIETLETKVTALEAK